MPVKRSPRNTKKEPRGPRQPLWLPGSPRGRDVSSIPPMLPSSCRFPDCGHVLRPAYG